MSPSGALDFSQMDSDSTPRSPEFLPPCRTKQAFSPGDKWQDFTWACWMRRLSIMLGGWRSELVGSSVYSSVIWTPLKRWSWLPSTQGNFCSDQASGSIINKVCSFFFSPKRTAVFSSNRLAEQLALRSHWLKTAREHFLVTDHALLSQKYA